MAKKSKKSEKAQGNGTTKLVPAAPAFTEDGAWSAEVCKKLRALRTNRINAKSRIDDLVKNRKELEEEIAAMGKRSTPERKEACEELVNVLQEIEYQRARLHTLADRMEQTMDRADNGELFEAPDDLSSKDFKSRKSKKSEEKDDPNQTTIADHMMPGETEPEPAGAQD